MPFLEILDTYFRGERAESLYFILPLGLACLAFAAAVLAAERSSFVVGVAGVFVVLGLALSAVGGGVGFRTASQVTTLHKEFDTDRAAFAVKEGARMEKVNANWPVYLATWTVFALLGLLLRFAVRHELANGVGIALVFFGGVGLLIDGFAERRARPYTEALSELRRETGGGR